MNQTGREEEASPKEAPQDPARFLSKTHHHCADEERLRQTPTFAARANEGRKKAQDNPMRERRFKTEEKEKFPRDIGNQSGAFRVTAWFRLSHTSTTSFRPMK